MLNTFDKIWVLDLHGNAKKKEVPPDGSADINVFDIMQGVAIIIGVKKRAKSKTEKPLAVICHGELWGDRKGKYETLWKSRATSYSDNSIVNCAPQFPFVPRNFEILKIYQVGFALNELMTVNGNGVVTKRDNFCIQDKASDVNQSLEDFLKLSENEVRQKYAIPEDVRDWKYEWAKRDVSENINSAPVVPINYRPFDQRYIFILAMPGVWLAGQSNRLCKII